MLFWAWMIARVAAVIVFVMALDTDTDLALAYLR